MAGETVPASLAIKRVVVLEGVFLIYFYHGRSMSLFEARIHGAIQAVQYKQASMIHCGLFGLTVESL